MRRKRIKVSRGVLFAWFMLAGFILIFTPHRLTNEFRFAFARIFRWPLSVGRNISLLAHTQQLPINVVSRSKYNRLRNHLANVTQWLLLERQKVEKLSGLRDRPVWQGVNFVLSDIISASDGAHNKLVISRGEQDGLAEGQFVLGNHSIIGTISDVSSRTAQVKLFTDPTSKIAVEMAGLDIGRIMHGTGSNSAKVKWLAIKHKVKIGGIVYASRKPGFLDVPMIIGTVSQCQRSEQNPLLWDIVVKPACNIKRLKDVNVIIMNPQE